MRAAFLWREESAPSPGISEEGNPKNGKRNTGPNPSLISATDTRSDPTETGLKFDFVFKDVAGSIVLKDDVDKNTDKDLDFVYVLVKKSKEVPEIVLPSGKVESFSDVGSVRTGLYQIDDAVEKTKKVTKEKDKKKKEKEKDKKSITTFGRDGFARFFAEAVFFGPEQPGGLLRSSESRIEAGPRETFEEAAIMRHEVEVFLPGEVTGKTFESLPPNAKEGQQGFVETLHEILEKCTTSTVCPTEPLEQAWPLAHEKRMRVEVVRAEIEKGEKGDPPKVKVKLMTLFVLKVHAALDEYSSGVDWSSATVTDPDGFLVRSLAFATVDGIFRSDVDPMAGLALDTVYTYLKGGTTPQVQKEISHQ